MNMYKLFNYLFLLSGIICLGGCSLLAQNDFVVSKDISIGEEETIYYDVFQTGIDNYTFKFKSARKTDTTELFEYYLNDAVYTAMRFNIIQKKDTLLITTNLPTDRMIGKTKKGIIVIFASD